MASSFTFDGYDLTSETWLSQNVDIGFLDFHNLFRHWFPELFPTCQPRSACTQSHGARRRKHEFLAFTATAASTSTTEAVALLAWDSFAYSRLSSPRFFAHDLWQLFYFYNNRTWIWPSKFPFFFSFHKQTYIYIYMYLIRTSFPIPSKINWLPR